ncbi:hypothetical protein [Deferribacter abyssi]|uniref:hypothetical protein n=1 Tax=Deferribacter abyssi TaxID=213806 RepID=UPI003C29C76F
MKIIFIILLTFVVSCSKTAKYSEYFTIVSGYLESYVKTVLKGNFKLAESFFKKAEKELFLADDYCNLARIYIKRYFIEEEFSENSKFYLNKANDFVNLSMCTEEKKIVNGLLKINLDSKTTIEFYNYYFAYLKSGDEIDLLGYLERYEVPDYVKSRVFRRLARDSFMKNLKKAEYYIKRAYMIDTFNSYSIYLLEDLKLMYIVCVKKGGVCDNLEKRKNSLQKMIKN